MTAGPANVPELYMNQCGSGGWLIVDLVGPDGNSEGIGAQIEVRAGSLRQTREMQTLRGLSQSPSRIHFGLGAADSVDSLRIRWPDSSSSAFEDVGGFRMVTIAHPSLVD